MRKELRKLKGQRMTFRATVERYGKKRAFRGPDLDTILLREVTRADTDEVVCDHLWFTAGKCWAGVHAGDTVTFDARVGLYEKGYTGWRTDVEDSPISVDYRLERPTKIRAQTTT